MGLPLSTLRFLTSPLRLLSSAVWKIVQQRDVLNYGMLEEFVTSVTESVPELLSYRQRAQLVLGLRAKLILELCRSENSPDHAIRDVDVETSESNFLALVEILLNDPVERNIFFQEVFPVEYGAKFDSALQKLIWTFVTRLEEVLPVPTLEMIIYDNLSCSLTGASPLPSSDHDCIFSCLSHPPLVRVVIGTEHRASDIELVSSFCEEVQAEPDVSMSTEKEEATVNKGENDVDVVEEGVGEGGSDVDVVEEGVGEGGSDVDVVEEGVGEGGNDVDVVEERVGEGGNDVDVVEERVGEGESLKQVEAEQQMETVRKAAETRHKLLHDQPRKPPKRLHKCAKCAEMFRTLYELGKHQRCHWGDDPLRCTQCGRRFSSTSHLTGHKQVHLLVCTLKCTMCEETCTELPSLRQHYAAAHQVKRAYPCSHCEKSFTELCSLRPYRCSQCPKSFISPSKLLLHEKAHAGTAKRERQHLCHECGKCFYTSAELTRHEVCHREDRPHTCAHCGKSFKRLRSLTSHMESHSDERVGHPCSYCGKLFSKPGALVRHNRIHTGERPHACGECHKRFLTHSEVQKHMRYHTGERPFKCAHCRKSFTQSCYLTAHMRTHTGERPYACGFCERRFADNAHMKRHLLIHTGEKPYVCEQCGKAFNRKNLLNLHLKAHLTPSIWAKRTSVI
uniref:C2H2-type domain-containing protein n=1 Tax=Denticeps clupeoides TaxID=299321 RepID=A0AAY4F017_9TELE